ncbi:BTAD domain-containing putative transcriptional regulator [Hoeflea sp. AS60]|uniref:BTAD domain-containing putative transcriptional regulator n=1 Tax=Hoeflea sp. AS60 TaxID=3135780 RepID=UPI003181837D
MTGQKRFRLKLLGNFQLFDPSGREIVLTNKRGKAIIAFLALSEEFSATRPTLYNSLWDSEAVSDKTLQERLRSCIRELKKSLGQDRYGFLIDTGQDSTLRLRTDHLDIDLFALKARLEHWSIEDGLSILDEIGSGTILSDFESISTQSSWLEDSKNEWKNIFSRSLNFVLEALTSTSEHILAPLSVGSTLLKLDPSDENVHYRMMLLYARQGNKAAAKQQYDACVRSLRVRLDLAPTKKTQTLMADIANDTFLPESPEADKKPILVAKSLGPTSIAVLPFKCPAESQEAKLLQVGICQGIIASLSRISEFTIIDYSSVIGLGDTIQPLKRVRQSLGVEFLLTGMIRSDGQKLRVTINLIKGDDEKVVWAKTHSSSLEEVFLLEDSISEGIAGELEPGLIQQAIKGALRSQIQNLTAYEWTLRAVPSIYQLKRGPFYEARTFLEKALEIDPNCAPAHTWLAFWYAFHTGQNWGNASDDLLKAHDHAQNAINLDTDDARAYAIAGHVKGFLFGELEAGEHLLDRALSLNQNSGFAWAFSAINQCYLGHPDEALKRMEMYKRLCPLDPYSFFFETINCIAYTLLEDYESACQWGRRTIDRNQYFANGYKPFLASLGHLGRDAEAGIYRERLLKLEPDFTVRKLQRTYHLRDRQMMQRYCEGLRKARIPEQ